MIDAGSRALTIQTQHFISDTAIKPFDKSVLIGSFWFKFVANFLKANTHIGYTRTPPGTRQSLRWLIFLVHSTPYTLAISLRSYPRHTFPAAVVLNRDQWNLPL